MTEGISNIEQGISNVEVNGPPAVQGGCGGEYNDGHPPQGWVLNIKANPAIKMTGLNEPRLISKPHVKRWAKYNDKNPLWCRGLKI